MILQKAPEYHHNSTNEADTEDKEEFYEQFSKITEKVPR